MFIKILINDVKYFPKEHIFQYVYFPNNIMAYVDNIFTPKDQSL